MLRLGFILTLLLFTCLFSSSPLYAMDAGTYQEFQKLLQTPLSVLTERAAKVFRTEDLRAALVPALGSGDISEILAGNSGAATHYDSSSIAHRIAAQKPELLSKQQCYSGTPEHRSVLECLRSPGQASALDGVNPADPVCVTEALLIFLWSELGVGHGEISAGIRLLYDPSVHEPPPFSP